MAAAQLNVLQKAVLLRSLKCWNFNGVDMSVGGHVMIGGPFDPFEPVQDPFGIRSKQFGPIQDTFGTWPDRCIRSDITYLGC